MNPHIGYDKRADISLTANHQGITSRDAAMRLGFLKGTQIDSWVRPKETTRPLGGDL
jgi:fumarate hydratase class II